MELWIRSQDRKRLIKVAYLELEKDDYGFYILGREDKFSGNRLGIYKTKERALEVLDEIQRRRKILNLIPYLENLSVPLWNRVNEFLHNEKDIFTYEMPKE